MNFDELSYEELKKEQSQLDAALRMAVSHGAELPQEVKERLHSMKEELARRDAADS